MCGQCGSTYSSTFVHRCRRDAGKAGRPSWWRDEFDGDPAANYELGRFDERLAVVSRLVLWRTNGDGNPWNAVALVEALLRDLEGLNEQLRAAGSDGEEAP